MSMTFKMDVLIVLHNWEGTPVASILFGGNFRVGYPFRFDRFVYARPHEKTPPTVPAASE